MLGTVWSESRTAIRITITARPRTALRELRVIAISWALAAVPGSPIHGNSARHTVAGPFATSGTSISLWLRLAVPIPSFGLGGRRNCSCQGVLQSGSV
jgi:hypothetical protein